VERGSWGVGARTQGGYVSIDDTSGNGVFWKLQKVVFPLPGIKDPMCWENNPNQVFRVMSD
jgi:hypothetical protein